MQQLSLFDVDYESNLIALCEEINNGTYQIGRSIAFIVNKPVHPVGF